MSERGVAQFISVVGLHFPRPKFNDDEILESAWVASMTRTLSGFSDEVLAQAAQKILTTRHPKRDGAFFPKPAECSDICVEIQRWSKASETPLLAKPNPNDWSDERLSMAFDLLKGEMGRRAAREGWVSALYHFCRKNVRLPNADEIGGCIASAKNVERIMAEIEQREPSAFNNAVLGLGRSVLQRGNELADRVLHGVLK